MATEREQQKAGGTGLLLLLAAGAGILFLASRDANAAAPQPIPGVPGVPPPPPPPPPPPMVVPPVTLPPVIITPTSDTGIAGLPDVPAGFGLRSQVQAALMSATDPATLDVLATTLDPISPSAAATVRARAAELRGTVPPPVVPSTAGKYATPQSITVHYIVVAGDTPIGITQRVTGNGSRYPELIAENQSRLGVDGLPLGNNGLAPPQLNFNRLHPGDNIILPKSWNVFVYQAPDGSSRLSGGVVLPPVPTGTATPGVIV